MKNLTHLTLVAALLLAAVARPTAAAAPWALDYTLRVDPGRRTVAVESKIRFPDAPGAVDLYIRDVDGHYTPGYVQFVEGVTLRGPDGVPVELSPVETGRWRPARPLSAGTYRLAYTVRVDHASKPSSWGLKETPTLDETGGVLIGAALFVLPVPAGGEPASVDAEIATEWELPQGWQALTPWKQASPRSQRPRSTVDLLDNFLVVGPPSAYDAFEAKLGDTVVMGVIRRGAWELSNAEMWRLFSSAMAHAHHVFGDMPAPAYLLVINPEPGTKATAGTSVGGGAARQSFHAMMDEKFTTSDLSTLHPLGILVHETFHWWNPTGLPPSPPADFYWWHEGVTVYYSFVLAWRAGIIAEEQFVAALRDAYDRGERRNASRPATSLVEASRKVSGDGGPEYDAVYNLGAILALELDLELRRRSNGAHSLDDLMRALYERHKKTGQTFTMKDLAGEASRLAGSSMEAFIRAGAEGRERRDWEAILAAVGYRETTVSTGRPMLGFSFVPDAPAATVQSVIAGAPAAAVLKPGDVVEAIDGQSVASQSDYTREMAGKKPGVPLRLGVRRDGARVDVEVTPVDRKETKLAGTGSDLLRAIGRHRGRSR
jgi:predicted metalloprotease with PDZ domain